MSPSTIFVTYSVRKPIITIYSSKQPGVFSIVSIAFHHVHAWRRPIIESLFVPAYFLILSCLFICSSSAILQFNITTLVVCHFLRIHNLTYWCGQYDDMVMAELLTERWPDVTTASKIRVLDLIESCCTLSVILIAQISGSVQHATSDTFGDDKLSSSAVQAWYTLHIGIILWTNTTQVAAVSRNGYYQLRQLWPLVQSISAKAVKTLAHWPKRSFPVTWTAATHCFTAFPRVWWAGCSLSRMWLHVWCRALNGTTTSHQCYRNCTGFRFNVGWISRWSPLSTCHCPAIQRDFSLSSCWLPVGLRRRLLSLRSATSRTCVVRRTYSNYGDRCFAAAGPKPWNSLPVELQQDDSSFQRFKSLLKTFLFGCWHRGALWLTLPLTHTYLLTQ